jgi:hypothetical protein
VSEITTRDHLDELPMQSVAVDAEGVLWRKRWPDGWQMGGFGRPATGETLARMFTFPGTVLVPSIDADDVLRGLASAPITASDEWPGTVKPTSIRCPECAAGKHGNCDGTALDTATDEFVPCPCASADHGRGGKRPPADHSADECSYELCTYCGCCAHGQAPAKGCLVAAAPAGMRCPNVDCGCEGQK